MSGRKYRREGVLRWGGFLRGSGCLSGGKTGMAEAPTALEAQEPVVKEWGVGACGFRGGPFRMEVGAWVRLWEWSWG